MGGLGGTGAGAATGGKGGASGGGASGTGAAGGDGGGTLCGNGVVDLPEACDPKGGPNASACNARCELCQGVVIGDQCFFEGTADPQEWGKARDACVAKGGFLATPQGGATLDALSASSKPAGDVFWAGVRQADGESKTNTGWTFRAGPDASKAFGGDWSSGEPNDSGDGENNSENCGCVIRSRKFRYDDKPCDAPHQVLCQRPFK